MVENAALTSYRDHTHVSPSAVHLGAKEPAVLGDGVAFNAAKRVARTSTAAHTKQNTWRSANNQRQNINFC